MKRVLINYGGVILFYLVIILGMVFINYDSSYMQKNNVDNFQVKEVNAK